MYNNILVAVDLTAASSHVVARAREIAQRCEGQLSLLHVVEYIPVDPAGEAMLPPPVNMEDELLDSAKKRLADLAASQNLEAAPCNVEIGTIKSEIRRIAEENGHDLIVLGSREKHGLALFLGSTEKSVLANAPCDVLAVKIA